MGFYPQKPSEWDQIVFFECLDLYHRSPDFPDFGEGSGGWVGGLRGLQKPSPRIT